MLSLVLTISLLGPTWSEAALSTNLTAQQRTGLATCVSTAWPDSTPSGIQYLGLTRTKGFIREQVTGTAAQFVADEDAGAAESLDDWNSGAGTATWTRSVKKKLVPSDAACFKSWADTVWSLPQGAQPASLNVSRVEGVFPADLTYTVEGTDAEYVAALAAGDVVQRVE